jgi:ABC-type transport system involved in multi-copper enzyme maturation permease subunit
MESMHSVWRSLLWKEWREHRWKLIALTAIFVTVPLLSALRKPENVYGTVSLTLTMVVPLASAFLAMHIAAGEQSRGTLPFLQSLPVSMRRPAAAKLLAALTTAVVPVLGAVAVAILVTWVIGSGAAIEAIQVDRNTYQTSWLADNWFAARALGGGLAAISIVVWIAAAGVNRSDEVRAAAVGLLVSLGAWAALVLLAFAINGREGMTHWWHVATAAAAGGPALSQPGYEAAELVKHGASRSSVLYPFALAALASHTLLITWFIARYGRTASVRQPCEERRVAAVEKSWLGPPRSRPLTALIWKQARESLPLAALAAGLILIVAVVLASYVARNQREEAMPVFVATSLAGWAVAGFFVSIVAGVGVFMDEMQPRLHAFWRSRPVSIDQWFLVKFVTGLAITVLTLAVPPLLAAGVALVAQMDLPQSSALSELFATGRNILIGHVALYCAAVLGIVLVRQAAYAAILTVAAAGVLLASLDYFLPELAFSRVLVIVFAAAIAAAIAAWMAVRKDWGWSP